MAEVPSISISYLRKEDGKVVFEIDEGDDLDDEALHTLKSLIEGKVATYVFDKGETICRTDLTQGERYSMLPVSNEGAWERHQEHIDNIWFATKLQFHEDPKQWKLRCSEADRHSIGTSLMFFANADNLIIELIEQKVLLNVTDPSMVAFEIVKSFMELEHAKSYSLAIKNVIQDPDERMRYFHAVDSNPIIGDKFEKCKKWLDCGMPIGMTYLVLAFIENVGFASAFIVIHKLCRMKNQLPGIAQLNEEIAPDEFRHVNHACRVVKNDIVNKIDQEVVHAVGKSFVDMEIEFARHVLKIEQSGLSIENMNVHIQYQANVVAVLAGYDLIYPEATKSPYTDFIKMLDRDGITNFFEKQLGGEYVNCSNNIQELDRVATDFDDFD